MKSYSKYFNAFTLAEMMVVLLIMSIVLACLAPAMTTKMKADQNIQTSPWKWSRNNIDAYFSTNSNQSAMIGQDEKALTDSAKLIINNSTNLDDMILFKNGNDVLGSIRFSNDGIRIGRSNNLVGQGSVGIGLGITATSNSVVTGNGSSSGNNGAILGNDSTAGNTGIVFGNDSTANDNAIAIGNSTNAYDNSIVIGNNINNTSENTISIGRNSSATDVGGTAVGDGAEATTLASAFGAGATANGEGSVALGANADTERKGSIVIGGNTSVSKDYGIAIGSNSKTYGKEGISIGHYASALYSKDIFIGYGNSSDTNSFQNIVIGNNIADSDKQTGSINIMIGDMTGSGRSSGSYNIGMGQNTLKYNASGSHNTAIGDKSCQYVKGSNKTCIGANSGPGNGHIYSKDTDNEERIFIGSQSKFNGGAAVLEVHNLSTKRTGVGGGYDDTYTDGCELTGSCSRANNSTVFINGNLVVRGTTFVTSKHYGGTSFVFKAIEHTGGQLEPAPHGDGWGDGFNQIPVLSSDRRLKYVGKESVDGLAKLKQLKVFNYTFKKDEKKTPHVGVIAQDLQKIFPNAVKKGADGFLTIRMEDMFFAVINAIKELDAKYQAQEKRIDELEKRIKALEAKIK